MAFIRIRYTERPRHREYVQSIYNEFLKQDPMTYKIAADILLQHTKTQYKFNGNDGHIIINYMKLYIHLQTKNNIF